MHFPGWPAAAVSAMVAIQLFAAGPPVASQESALSGPESPFVICSDQRYALCAAARCIVYNSVAYCECDVLKGDSISLQLDISTPTGEKDVCDLMADGRVLGYTVSTFSPPADADQGGPLAAYTCPGTANQGGGVPAPVAYGQCDGGICFASTTTRSFEEGELHTKITCSCPISTGATPGSADAFGYQIFGPYHPLAPVGQRCDPSGCAACSVPDPTGNGSIIPVGAPSGVGRVLTELLTGSIPAFNECLCECPGDGPCTVRDDITP